MQISKACRTVLNATPSGVRFRTTSVSTATRNSNHGSPPARDIMRGCPAMSAWNAIRNITDVRLALRGSIRRASTTTARQGSFWTASMRRWRAVRVTGPGSFTRPTSVPTRPWSGMAHSSDSTQPAFRAMPMRITDNSRQSAAPVTQRKPGSQPQGSLMIRRVSVYPDAMWTWHAGGATHRCRPIRPSCASRVWHTNDASIATQTRIAARCRGPVNPVIRQQAGNRRKHDSIMPQHASLCAASMHVRSAAHATRVPVRRVRCGSQDSGNVPIAIAIHIVVNSPRDSRLPPASAAMSKPDGGKAR
jgi:hypothetical protein